MDFDVCKENIQPLRGGRNATQLEIALQAQTTQELQRELQHQREQFESAIKNYNGDDPLHNWYHYISWIEQSYPKHGHEGNLVPLLEDCLQKFENDPRYTNDQRMCKLWIKYNDLQPNPLELYHMMHARGLCRGCSNLYIAWAYYHEAVGDFRSADMVFQLGKRELAQPYEELVVAHQNMVYAAGQQVISGTDERRLVEQRQALTTLRTYKPGKVGSVRVPASGGAAGTSGMFPSTASTSKSNYVIPVFEDKQGVSVTHAAVPPDSILSVAKRQVAPKENTIKPGTWTTSLVPCKTTASKSTTPQFTILEDAPAVATASESEGLRLPKDFYPITHENFSDWKSVLSYPEPDDPSRIPMYPKSKVYPGGNIEFSIEEIRARRCNLIQILAIETEQAIQSILGGSAASNTHNDEMQITLKEHDYGIKPSEEIPAHVSQVSFNQPKQSVTVQAHSLIPQLLNSIPHPATTDLTLQSPASNIQQHSDLKQILSHVSLLPNSAIKEQITLANLLKESPRPKQRIFGQNLVDSVIKPTTSSNHGPIIDVESNDQDFNELGNDMDVLWRSNQDDSLSNSVVIPKANATKFVIFEESSRPVQPKGSAMRTMPFKILSDEELAETGSRGGLDVAAAAQPGDEAKAIIILDDEDSNSLPGKNMVFDASSPCNTEIFNFNLATKHASTPHNLPFGKTNKEALKDSKKQLFGHEPEKQYMSTILEERSSSSSSSTFKSSGIVTKRDAMPVISEENKNYLAQNLMANAALRTTLFELMECESEQSSPVNENATPLGPLMPTPSDPFRPSVLKALLQKMGFPGKHSNGYIRLNVTPRLHVRKELIHIADDRYLIEKVLGKGTYGQVFKAVDFRTKAVVALKYQKPTNCWEYYICKEIQCRLANHPMRGHFMDITAGYFNDEVSIFASEFSPSGSLLDVAKIVKQKTGRPLKESMCIYFCLEMLRIVQLLHQIKIIHADIKPDNFLLYVNTEGLVQLQLIDFGCSIDMSLFPPGSTFNRRITTENFECCEMRDGKPWNYHTDLFCVAASTHVLLFEKYMNMEKKQGTWSITQKIQRYMRIDLWNMFFSTLLNQPEGAADPDILIILLEDAKTLVSEEINREMRTIVNILENR